MTIELATTLIPPGWKHLLNATTMPITGVRAGRFSRSLQIRYRTKNYKNGYQTYPGIVIISPDIIVLHGRGSVVPIHSPTRIHVPPEKLDHFLSFITSAHIVQDLPFGEKSLKLSSSVQIKVPNVIRTMIPAKIVKQYESHCNESGFSPMSRSTLCRILNVC